MGVRGLLVAAVAFSLALTVLLAAPGRTQNRRLALVLFLEGTSAFGGGGLLYVTDSPGLGYAAQSTTYLAFGMLTFAYLYFLATLPSPVTRWMRRRPVEWTILAGMLAFAVLYMVRTDLFLAGVGPAPHARLEGIGGPWTVAGLILPSFPVFAFGLLAAITMWRSAPRGSIARRQGAIYALAFAIRDLAWFSYLLNQFILGLPLPLEVVLSVGLLAFYLILGYGMLSTQLLGIDLRIKWTIRKSTLAASFILVFFVVAQAAQAFLTTSYGWAFGGVAAGLLLFAIAPLQRFAERVANRAMPNVQDTQEYRTVRKLEVYRAALEEALIDGVLSQKDRAVLAALQDQLGITATDANRMEREVGQTLPKPRGVG